jgi:hypothetical protein
MAKKKKKALIHESWDLKCVQRETETTQGLGLLANLVPLLIHCHRHEM